MQTIIKRNDFLAILNHESNKIISWTMGFFDEKVAERLLGKDCIFSDILPGDEFGYGASPQADWEVKARYAANADMPAVPVGKHAGLAFGHGGPGEFTEQTEVRTDELRITRYETGVRKEVRYNPHFYHHYDYPLQELADFVALQLPNPDDPARYANLAEEIAYHQSQDLMTFANLNGFFSGVHYFLYPYEKLLADLLLNPEAVERVINTLGEYNLKVAEHLLKAGVDIICFCDDLGSGNSLLMSPELYRKYFRKWHAALADLCHGYGRILHMHSHGNIKQIMNDLCDIGIDILNPVDPSEGMDMASLLRDYGKKITFAGGINKFFYSWPRDEQKKYLTNLFSTVKYGFFLMDSGGIPENVQSDDWCFLQETKNFLKEKYGR